MEVACNNLCAAARGDNASRREQVARYAAARDLLLDASDRRAWDRVHPFRVLGWPLITYGLVCMAIVVIAQVGAIAVATLASVTRIGLFVSAIFGAGVVDAVAHWLGTAAYALITGLCLVEVLGWLTQPDRHRSKRAGAIAAAISTVFMPLVVAAVAILLPSLSPALAAGLLAPNGIGQWMFVWVLYALIPGSVGLLVALRVRTISLA